MNDKIRDKYRPFISNRWGIFTPATRKRLLRLSPGRSGWSKDTADFRYKVRGMVEQALNDLALFLEVADEKDIYNILNDESLKPVIQALFWNTTTKSKPNASLAKIANLLIWHGFNYLKTQNPIRLPTIINGQIDSAIEINDYLTDSFVSSSREEVAGNPPIRARGVFL